MSSPVIRFALILGFIALILILTPRWLKRAFPKAWSQWLKQVTTVAYLLVAAGIFMRFLRGVVDLGSVATMISTVSAIAFLGIVFTFLSALIWVPAMHYLSKRRVQTAPDFDDGRRAFLAGAVGTLPAASALASPMGAVEAVSKPVLTEVDIEIEGLHPELEGLKILQMTDIHLGTHIDVSQIESVLESAKPHSPDLVVLTGDVADDFKKLVKGLEVIGDFAAPMGAFACIGNHEIYRGRARAEAIYAKSDVKLLCDGGQLLQRGAGRLWIAGSDDPARLGSDHRQFLKEAVGRSMADCPGDADVKLLLCHRPEGFETAAEYGVDLTLAGHTHGGQVAVGGRSVFEPFAPGFYLLGHYQKDKSHLYTSAGLGHWMPFRLNCPCEGVLITLKGV